MKRLLLTTTLIVGTLAVSTPPADAQMDGVYGTGVRVAVFAWQHAMFVLLLLILLVLLFVWWGIAIVIILGVLGSVAKRQQEKHAETDKMACAIADGIALDRAGAPASTTAER